MTTTLKIERRGTYQGVPQYSITGAAEITPSRKTAQKWLEQAEAERRYAAAGRKTAS